MTDQLFSTDAYLRETDATVVDVRPGDDRVLLDRTVFYPGGGGQPPDHGELIAPGQRFPVVGLQREGRDHIWHELEGSVPSLGDPVRAVIDWDRRHLLMRTHTAMHALCGVIWNRYEAPVTGSGMEPGRGRLDFELPDWSREDLPDIEEELNEWLGRDLEVEIDFVPREELERRPDLIRTRISLLPAWVEVVRVVDIVGLDRQADGGTHVASTGEVGPVEITGVESKGRGFRRFRLVLPDRQRARAGDSGDESEPDEVAA